MPDVAFASYSAFHRIRAGFIGKGQPMMNHPAVHNRAQIAPIGAAIRSPSAAVTLGRSPLRYPVYLNLSFEVTGVVA